MNKTLTDKKLHYIDGRILRYKYRIKDHRIKEDLWWDYNQKYKQKSNNRQIQMQQKLGTLQGDEECALCGATEQIQRHHENYELPTVIIYLCNSCHQRIHRIENKDD